MLPRPEWRTGRRQGSFLVAIGYKDCCYRYKGDVCVVVVCVWGGGVFVAIDWVIRKRKLFVNYLCHHTLL